jgi:eukaryotic-like serine/threonine-protein kinase
VGDHFVLARGLRLTPVEDLPAAVAARLGEDGHDIAVTVKGSRHLGQLVDARVAEFLEEFADPKPIEDAVVAVSRRWTEDPEEVLDALFPVIQRFCRAGFLVSASSPAAMDTGPELAPGNHVPGGRVVRALQVTSDSEVYCVRSLGGGLAALKLVRRRAPAIARAALANEAAVLAALGGEPAPELLERGDLEGRPYLLLEWCEGVAPDETAARAVALAYAVLHERGVVHGDVHPRNVIVAPDGRVRLVDFGFARRMDYPGPIGPRGGIGYFAEPELARALLSGRPPPPPTAKGEQYSVAVLLYLLLNGRYPIELSLDRSVALRQIAYDAPGPMEDHPGLARALAKEPASRWPDLRSLAASLPPPAVPGRPRRDALALLEDRYGLESRLLDTGLPAAPTASVNFGGAGVAYALYRAALLSGEPRLLEAADVWVTRARRDTGKRDAFVNTEMDLGQELLDSASPYHAQPGPVLVDALVAVARGDMASAKEAVETYAYLANRPVSRLDLVAGRAGTLLGCALLLDVVPPGLPTRPRLVDAGRRLHAELWSELDALPTIGQADALPWLGVAHGWAGILFAAIRWALASEELAPPSLDARLEELARLGRPDSGGLAWPRSLVFGRAEEAGPLGWCHGSAGHVFLWEAAYRLTSRDDHALLADAAARSTWGRAGAADGSLCCGLAGQGHALFARARVDNDRAWRARARKLAFRGGERVARWPDSLYRGAVGTLLTEIEADAPQDARMPLFEPEGAA